MNVKGIIKLTIFCWIKNHNDEEKLVAIKNANGGPKTTQHKNAMMRSEVIKRANFCFLVNSLSVRDKFFIFISS